MSAACAGVLALGAVVSTPSAPPLSRMVVPFAEASDVWMDAGAGQAARELGGVARELVMVPQTVLGVAASMSDATITTMVPGLADARTALAEGDAMSARTAADGLLVILRSEVDAHYVDLAVAAPVAEQLCGLRADAIWALGGAPHGSQGEFLKRTVVGASLGDWEYGVPASVTLAQAILESDWGRSAPGHNLFGLKGTGPAGSSVQRVVEYRHGRRGTRQDPFRAYHNEGEALADHARILGTRPRYARARSAGDDRRAFARALVGIYASDPGYAGKLDRIIGLFALDRFDWLAPAGAQAEPAPPVFPEPNPDPLASDLPWRLPAGWGASE